MKTYSIYNSIFYMLYIILNPSLLYKYITKNIYIPVYVQFKWLKKIDIKTAIDVGCYKGNVSQTINTLFPKAKIYAFEPNLSLHTNIKSKIRSDSFVLSSFGLGNKKGESNFYIYKNTPASSILKRKKTHIEKQLKIPMTTLNNYFKEISLEEPTLLKIDTQGNEQLVLEGGNKILKKISIIHIEASIKPEYTYQKTFHEIYLYLTSKGFEYFGEVQESYFYPLFGPRNNANHIFINKQFLSRNSFEL